MTMASIGRARLAATAIALSLASVLPAHADPLADFYAGRTLSYIVDTAPGGAYDLYTRLVARHIGDHIPGHPTIVVQNMPGSGGRTAANWLANIAPKDGSVLATMTQSLAVDQMLSPSGLRFDARKLNWIGTAAVTNNLFVTWHTSGVTTIDDARRKPISVGSTGGNSPNQMYPAIMNAVLGTKFKIVRGYKSGNDIDLAMERGELDGRPAVSWQSLKLGQASWIENHKINILVQVGPRKEPELAQVPLLTELARDDEQRQILRFVSSAIGMGRPTATTTGLPHERLAMLRRAFDATMKDPAFLADAAKQNVEISPQSGEELQALVEQTVNIPPSLLARIKAALVQ